jgi:hypothetical protein
LFCPSQLLRVEVAAADAATVHSAQPVASNRKNDKINPQHPQTKTTLSHPKPLINLK